jgi:hypothetical protein
MDTSGCLIKIRSCIGRYAKHIDGLKADLLNTGDVCFNYNELGYDLVKTTRIGGRIENTKTVER